MSDSDRTNHLPNCNEQGSVLKETATAVRTDAFNDWVRRCLVTAETPADWSPARDLYASYLAHAKAYGQNRTQRGLSARVLATETTWGADDDNAFHQNAENEWCVLPAEGKARGIPAFTYRSPLHRCRHRPRSPPARYPSIGRTRRPCIAAPFSTLSQVNGATPCNKIGAKGHVIDATGQGLLFLGALQLTNNLASGDNGPSAARGSYI